MKIKAKLIASVFALAAVASVPALTAFATYASCTTNIDSKEISVSLGSTPECRLIDKDKLLTMPLTYIQCRAGNYYQASLFHNSYEWVKVRAGTGLTATVKIAISFLGNDGKTVTLCDLGEETFDDSSLITISNQTSVNAIKEGHILVTCKQVKQANCTTNVDTYVNYAFGY
ncbi:MAG: hypothetical protein ACI4M3_07505 [Acutalibacteraceae bacterium]